MQQHAGESRGEGAGWPVYHTLGYQNRIHEIEYDERMNGKGKTAADIEAVVGRRRNNARGGEREVLVKWRGFGSEYNSWVSRHEIATAAPEMVAASEILMIDRSGARADEMDGRLTLE
eukprot:COSAG01_NODE_32_length_35644_cov_22.273738_9_plen_118_part_00